MREANGEGECLGARSLSEDFIEACSDQVRNLWHGVYWTSEVCCKLIPEVAFMNEKGKKKINFPHRLADSQAEVFPRPPTTPPPRPLRFLVCRTCLFLEVPTLVPAHCLGWKSERKRTQGALWEADLHFLTDAGDWVSPSRLPPRAGGDAN